MSSTVDLESKESQTELDMGIHAVHRSAHEEYQAAVNRVLEEGIGTNPDLKEEMEIPFFYLSIKGDTFRVKQMLETGISINVIDYYGRIALHLAADNSNLRAVSLLLIIGADSDFRDDRGETALSLAIKAKTSRFPNSIAA